MTENLLDRETSPYLLQHKNNPVHWLPWGEEAFERAKAENKPILLSVGYAACHWCHVMAHESFGDEQTAKIMNDKFINIKLDREERPDLDNIYQNSISGEYFLPTLKELDVCEGYIDDQINEIPENIDIKDKFIFLNEIPENDYVIYIDTNNNNLYNLQINF